MLSKNIGDGINLCVDGKALVFTLTQKDSDFLIWHGEVPVDGAPTPTLPFVVQHLHRDNTLVVMTNTLTPAQRAWQNTGGNHDVVAGIAAGLEAEYHFCLKALATAFTTDLSALPVALWPIGAPLSLHLDFDGGVGVDFAVTTTDNNITRFTSLCTQNHDSLQGLRLSIYQSTGMIIFLGEDDPALEHAAKKAFTAFIQKHDQAVALKTSAQKPPKSAFSPSQNPYAVWI